MLHRNWLAGLRQWSSGSRSRVAQSRKPRRLPSVAIEELESRCYLSATTGDDRSPADALLAERQFLVQLTSAATSRVQTLDQAQTIFASGSIDLRAARGLGTPGLWLVTSSEPDVGRITSSLRANRSVAYFEADSTVQGQVIPNDSLFGDQVGLLNSGANGTTSDADIDADEAWNISTGSSSVVVSIIDSGVDYTHPDLYLNIWLNPGEIPAATRASLIDSDADGRITFRDLNAPVNASFVSDLNGTSYIDAGDLLQDVRWENGVDNDGNGRTDDLIGWDFRSNDNDPFDTHGHGTHVAGTIGAVGNNASGVAGLNWNTSIMPLRFLDSVAGQGLSGSTSDAITAINYTTAMKTRSQDAVNVRVSNNSWGSLDTFSQSLRDAIAVNGAAGILFVAAAGNGEGRTGSGVDLDAEGLGFFPASFDLDHIVAVAATNSNDSLATFSQFGATSIDLAAPGVAILSTEPGGGFAFRSGTSMATPHVAGAAALVFARIPDASTQEVRQALLQSIDVKSSLTGKVATGGRLNARAALEIDTFAPKAALVAAPNVTLGGASSYDFQVRYRDNADIDFNSLDNADVRVVPLASPDAPLSATISNLVLDSDPITAGNQPIVTYRIVPPGGSWSLDDNGEFRIELLANAVADTRAETPNLTPAQTLGTFEVSIAYEGQILVTTFADGADSNPADSISQTASGQSTLRSAIQTANTVAGLNTIVLEPGVYFLNLAGAGEDASATGDLDITSQIVILGNGAEIRISGGIDRVLDVLASGNLTLRDVTIAEGVSSSSGGGLRNAGITEIHSSTFAFNSAATGGAIASIGSSLSLTNSTVSTNMATDGAGLDVSGGSLSLLNVTVTANEAINSGGGVLLSGSAMAGVTNTIIAGNMASTSGPDVFGTFSAASSSHNLIGISDGSTGLTNGIFGNLVGSQANQLDPKLGPLAFNSGLTMTHELQAGSPAIDTAGSGPAPEIDQRGITRPVDADGDLIPEADIGAVERYFGEISGIAFNDTDQDGIRDAGEVGLSDFQIFLDLNANGVLDLTEPMTWTVSDNPTTPGTDETGQYRFDQLTPGSYRVQLVVPTGWDDLSPVINPNEGRFDLTTLTAASGADSSQGFILNGVDSETRLGQAGGGLGDFNGDGLDDMVVAGKEMVYLVLGTQSPVSPERSLPASSGSVASAMRIRPNGFFQTPNAQIVGDLDGDGAAEMVFSVGFINSTLKRAWLIYGKTGALPSSIAPGTPSETGGFEIVELFGPYLSVDQSLGRNAVTDITSGDLNGDGRSDLVVSYREADPAGRTDAGQTIVLFGRNTRFSGTLDLTTLTATDGVVINGVSTGDSSGASVASGGDVNGDGFDDLVISAPKAFREGTPRGEIYVVFGGDALPGSIELSVLPSQLRGAVIRCVDRFSDSNQSVAVGDFNGDHLADVFLAKPENSALVTASVFFGSPQFGNSGIILQTKIAEVFAGGVNFRIGSNMIPDQVDNAGDVNGDGIDDFLVGAPGVNLPSAQFVGGAVLIFGATQLSFDFSGVDSSQIDARHAILINGIAAFDFTGTYVSRLGDLNGDGLNDILIGAREADPIANASGRAFVVYGRPDAQIRPRNGFYQVDLNAGGSVANADFGNRPIGATLRGNVYRDLNSNATRDAGEAGITGFQIFLDLNNDGSLTSGEPTATSDVNGNYVFANVAPLMTYRVREVLPSGFTQTFPTPSGIHIVAPQPGEEISLLDFGNVDLVGGVGLGTGALSGRIFNDVNGNGQMDGGEVGLAGVTVFVDLNDNGVRDASPVSEPQFVTSADGLYSFTGLPARDYPVRIETPAEMTLTSPRAGQFTAASTAAGQGPVAAASIDFNGDPFLDMVIVTASKSDVLVRLNNGDGTFGAPFSVVGTSARAKLVDPRSLAVADLNGDGRADLVIGNNSLSLPAVLLNNGAGLFVPVTVPALVGGIDSSAVAIGKFNQSDNFPDIVVASEFGDRVYVLINNGSGVFTLRDTLTPGSGPVDVLAVDLDNDGDSDVVVANRDDNTLRTFLLQSNNTFLTANPGGVYTKATGNGPFQLAAADLNGDGAQDVVVANVFDQRISVFFGQTSGGVPTGAFANAQHFQVGGNPASVTIGDLNGDGLPDLAVSTLSEQGFTTLLNLGGGQFQAPTAAGVASLVQSLAPTILASDIEADGDADLVILQPTRDGGQMIIQRNAPFASSFRIGVIADQTVSGLNFGLIDGVLAAGSTLSVSATNAVRSEGNAGNTAFTFTVTRSGDVSGTSSINFAVTGNTANAATGADFGGTLPSGTVSFAANEEWKVITLNVSGDTAVEADEGFLVTLSNPSSGSSLGTATATGTILNDDASLSISAVNASRAEGHSGNTGFTFAVTRAGNTSGTATVEFAVTGSGANAATTTDFGGTFPSGSVSFAANETTKIITVNVSGDTSVENDEGFTVTLSNPTGNAILGTSTASGTILNDDSSLSIAATNANRAEGTSGNTPFTFTVTRAGDVSGAASVHFAVMGSGGSAADADDFGGSLPTGTVNFAASETSQVLTINVSGDTVFEADEGFTVTLSNPTSGSVLSTSAANGTILNDEAALAISALNANRAEGQSSNTPFTFTVTRSGNTSGAASVSFAVTGSGTNPAGTADFGGTFPSGTLNFAANETSKTITVNVSGETLVEEDESFTVTLSNPTNGASLSAATATGTILNDDASLSITATNAIRVERNAGTSAFEFTVTRTGNSVGTASVNFAVTGSGPTANRANAADFGSVLPSGTINFAANETSKTLNINVRGDLTVETDEQFTVTLSNPSAGAALGTSTAIGRILNDEFVVEVVVDENGNLAINDLGGLTNNITVTRNTTTNMFVVTSPANELSPDGLSPTNSISIPVSSVTGGLIADLGPGNDKLTLSSLSLSATVLGGDGNDTVLGSGGTNLLLGEAGDDSLTGLTSNDTLSGGIGKDALIAGNSTGVDLLLEDVAGIVTLTATALTVNGVADTLSGFERFSLTGSDGNDTITATAMTLAITLNGGAGNDSLTGGASADQLNGGDDNDTLVGGAGNDTLAGEAGADRLTGGAGVDQLNGGSELDLVVESADANFTLTDSSLLIGAVADPLSDIEGAILTGGAAANTLNASAFTLGGVSLFGGAGNDTLTGSNLGDSLNGQAGDDQLIGADGDDRLTGEAGNDSFNTGLGNDSIVEIGNANLTMTGVNLTGLGTDPFVGDAPERALLTGGTGNNTLRVMGFTGAVTLQGLAGNDILIGGPNADSLDGGEGLDSLTGNGGGDTLNGGNGVDAVIESGATSYVLGSTDWIVNGVAGSVVAIEQVRLTAASTASLIDASSFAGVTTLTGGVGDDTLRGGLGIDSILAGDGNDELSGGASNDILDGGLGMDTVRGDAGADKIFGQAGNDTLQGGIGNDVIDGGIGDDAIAGQEDDDSLLGGDGNDTIIGAAGKDTLKGGNNDDLLIGGNGVDSLSGDGGNDRALGGQGGVARGGTGLKDVGDVLSAEIIDELFADLFDFE